MRDLLKAVVGAMLAALRSRASLVTENLALRQQLAILRRQTSRPQLRPVVSGNLSPASCSVAAVVVEQSAEARPATASRRRQATGPETNG